MPDKSAGSAVASQPEKKYPLPRLAKPKALAGTVYRGNVGMWSWVLHRITGVSIFFFLLVHILDSTLLRVSPEAYNAVIGTYKNPLMGLGEVVLVAAIGLHALNGLRVILVDFWAWGTKHQKLLQWIGLVLWIILLIGFVPRHLMNVFAE
ncbi:MAG: succinate dehydrogenase, cytochrome b556 subunit [Cryobacterium sp.]|nr:succinate dehydrogenase, cytochrome b556 subunit [Cryobacterium sp.]MBX3090000.1 succinate dehydrogenase, cytochrome b556 subunit [Cryobacterium sp.]MBX3116607.1 succinate dehydrogenase, cytochrome b556 subunit [Cryobacterium sp.]MCC7127285.1 succinate dehydrogenase, cytochrome b556 subunit [Microbacteriaceae bacterium]MCW5944208.1 succinate dehydrogenase, cytochrome b556 subunit [Cryobacterium sp.]